MSKPVRPPGTVIVVISFSRSSPPSASAAPAISTEHVAAPKTLVARLIVVSSDVGELHFRSRIIRGKSYGLRNCPNALTKPRMTNSQGGDMRRHITVCDALLLDRELLTFAVSTSGHGDADAL